MDDDKKLRGIENSEVKSDFAVDNDHALHDVQHENKFVAVNDALAKEKTKRRSKPLTVLLVAFVLALLGGGATLAVYKAYFEKPPVQPATPAQPTAQTPPMTSNLTAKEIVALVTPKLTGTPADTSPATPLPYNAPSVKVSGTDFYVTTSSATEVAGVRYTVGASQSAIDVASVGKTLSDKGFTAKALENPNPDDTYSMYSHADVVCGVENASGSNTAAAHTVTVACYDMTAYEALATSLRPFAAAYTAAQKPGGARESVRFSGKPVIKDSRTPGYKLTTIRTSGYDGTSVHVGGFISLFYQTPDGTWHFFKGTQSELRCSDYNTPDLKKAYLGEQCGDEKYNMSTVKL